MNMMLLFFMIFFSRMNCGFSLLLKWPSLHHHRHRNDISSFRNLHKLLLMSSSSSHVETEGVDVNTKWLQMFEQLEDFYKQAGHSNVPHNASSLGAWVYHQRRKYKRKSLTQDKVDQLEKINFQWQVGDTKWKSKFDELLEYKAIHGHCNVPYNDDNQSLARWVSTQRKAFRKWSMFEADQSRRNQQTSRFAALKELGFEFDPKDSKWEEKFAELKAFKLKNGHCHVPRSCKSLWNWISQQRRLYRNMIQAERNMHDSSGHGLSPKRFHALKNIGFDFDPCDNVVVFSDIFHRHDERLFIESKYKSLDGKDF